MELLFATHNKHKVEEARKILGTKVKIESLEDIGFFEEIPETNPTIRENARQKADFMASRGYRNVMADDSGLMVHSLDDAPGVYSARYAGEHASYADNRKKVLEKMQGVENRKACFITVICLIWQNKTYFFEGTVNGIITLDEQGENGFGYDSIFLPEGYERTFAQMSSEEKNAISHRALALQEMLKFSYV